jgi:hypothetical protein
MVCRFKKVLLSPKEGVWKPIRFVRNHGVELIYPCPTILSYQQKHKFFAKKLARNFGPGKSMCTGGEHSAPIARSW